MASSIGKPSNIPEYGEQYRQTFNVLQESTQGREALIVHRESEGENRRRSGRGAAIEHTSASILLI
jgi:hypothetical protein